MMNSVLPYGKYLESKYNTIPGNEKGSKYTADGNKGDCKKWNSED